MGAIYRNFLSVIRRYRLAIILNILGLSVAFAAFMVIMIQLDYDFGFDKFHKDADRIFRLEFSQKTITQAIICRPLAERFFESSPHIVAGTVAQSWSERVRFHIEGDNIPNVYEETSFVVTPTFFDVFTFDFIEGSREGYIASGNVFIPSSLSRKLFGNESAVGKHIVFNDSEFENQTVMAVYRDFPSNSILDNCIYLAMRDSESKDDWSEWSYVAYIRVNDQANAPLLFDNFKRNFDAKAFWGDDFDWDENDLSMRLTALSDLHYVKNVKYDDVPKASKQTLMIMFAIAIVIIVIAAINFTNFSTALAPMRIKSINTQRVMGARRNRLRLSMVLETTAISFLSYFVAILFVLLFYSTPLSRLVDADLSLVAHPLIVGGTALVALVVGVFASLSPSFYITSFAPALVLKGSFGLSPKGKKLRNTLIVIQFIASFALIIGASFMYLQNYYMQNSPLGYIKDEIIIVNISAIQKSRDALINQLKMYSGIEDVTYGESLLSSSDGYMEWGRQYNGERIRFQCLPVHYTFLKVMEIEISEGRDFRAEDAKLQYGAYVFNETARKQYNMELGSKIGVHGEIIGFVSDIKFASFRNVVEPMAFYVWGTENWGDRSNNMYIKVKAGSNMREAMSHVRVTLSEFDAEYPFVVRFYDEILQLLYEKEIALGMLITLFSLLAMFISIVGVFGLVVFDSECRRKEIGIRKVHGSSTTSIILLFNKVYLSILLICFVIATPLAWYAVSRWLENFAYRTPMYLWVYLLAFIAVTTITIATVTFQNWRAANENPIDSIKSE